ncbi:MAG: ASPIC/UnbV domain-containing protein, partial [Dokdonia sp.]|nr:ASPIC/UnbV domain-containing protein [Dokdonia sp.]
NNDGFIDFIAGYADSFNVPSTTNSDQLFINNGNSNNWSKIILEGVESNLNGIGARVEIYGAWGMQIREVRSGESYGTQNSLITHFGIGDETTIDQIIVRWPSGIVDVIASPDSNTALNLREGDSELSLDDTSLAVFSLYPNPANSSFTIATPSPVEGSLSIYDITGKQVINEDLMALTEHNIDISELTAGVYFVSLGTQTIKLIKR